MVMVQNEHNYRQMAYMSGVCVRTEIIIKPSFTGNGKNGLQVVEAVFQKKNHKTNVVDT